jgi:hypothetical protein
MATFRFSFVKAGEKIEYRGVEYVSVEAWGINPGEKIFYRGKPRKVVARRFVERGVSFELRGGIFRSKEWTVRDDSLVYRAVSPV